MNFFRPAFLLRPLSRLSHLVPWLLLATGTWWLLAVLMPVLAPAALTLRLLAMPNTPAAAGMVAQQSWFGVPVSAESTAPAAMLTLTGLMGSGVASGGDFAIVQENGTTLVLRPGASSPAGWVLVKVEGQGIVVSRGGVEQRIMLQRPSSQAATTVMASPSTM